MSEAHRLFYPHLIRSFATTSAYDRAREAMTSSVSQQACAAAFSARQLGSAARKRASAAPRRGAMRVVAAAAASPQAHFSGESCALTTSVIAPTVEEALAEIVEAVEGGADIVELRVDFIDGLDAPVDIPKMLAACAVPCIVTYRPTWEGGQYAGEEEPRLAALWAAVAEIGAQLREPRAVGMETARARGAGRRPVAWSGARARSPRTCWRTAWRAWTCAPSSALR